MRKIIVILLILSVAAYATTGCYDSAKFPKWNQADTEIDKVTIIPGASPSILLLGDSRLYFAPFDTLGNEIINYSAPGSTLSGVEMRLPELGKYKFDTVIIEVGLNDICGLADINFIERYRRVVMQLKPQCGQVIICGIFNVPQYFLEFYNPYFRHYLIRRYNDRLRNVAAETGCVYFDPIVFDYGNFMDVRWVWGGEHLNDFNDEGNKLFMEFLRGLL